MTQERSRPVEPAPELVSAFAAAFINRHDLYPVQLPTGRYVQVKKSLTNNLIAYHPRGQITLGAYALDQAGWAKWICFDADDERQFEKLKRMAEGLSSAGIVPYLELSRRGGHLWLFTPVIPGFQARRFGAQLQAEFRVKGIELFPKQDRPGTGAGSFVRLPLGVHHMTGKRYPFVTSEGAPLATSVREHLTVFASRAQVSQAYIDEVLARAPAAQSVSRTPSFSLRPDIDGPVSERIKNRVSVYEFVGQFVELDQQVRGHCPFHDDEHQSFQVSQEGNYWNCYAGCGGGSVIDFWMKWRQKRGEDGRFKATVKELAQMLLKD